MGDSQRDHEWRMARHLSLRTRRAPFGERRSHHDGEVRRVRPRCNRRAAPDPAVRTPIGKTGALTAVRWAATVTFVEAAARRIIPSRARAWLVAYSALGLVARWSRPRRRVPRRGSPLPGAVVAVAGYPLGRALLGDHPVIPPPDSAGIELAALGGTLAAAEELIWGGLVEPELGMGVTSVL